ncbi:MAG: bacillithiol biosynthesis deacetylase BshB1 [Coriobacteriia bacterium]
MIDALCVGAHPDDVEIGMGGTVAGMVRRGLEVAIVDLTDGEPTPAGSSETRAKESAAAAAVLGARRRTLDLPNRSLFDGVAERTALAEVIRELKPRLLFLPYPEDAHPDHVAAAAIGEAARFWAKFVKTEMSGEPHYPEKVYHYYAVHLRLLKKPAFVVDISPDLAAKMDALRCYASQFSANPRNAEVLPTMEMMARSWGALIGTAAGEPFFCREEIGVARVEDLV